ncbi:hypothetical protein F5B19DRAFT_241487 [Rostrohypoxylon terebratum]|nr:hypothetical protein F5B19DRAFT_241487 [Rostrohypoxylon terebratum]
MAYNNSASSGAIQYNIGVQIAPTQSYTLNIISRATTVASAQRFGSPLDTRQSYNPLQELIQASNGGDIIAKRYHGDGIYAKMKGLIVDPFGYTRENPMDEIVKKTGEAPTQLSTIIVCLSVALSKTSLCQVVSTAILLYSHDQLDQSMEGDLLVIQAQVDKYANAVLSRDGMCNKLELAKQAVRNRVESYAPPRIKRHALFLPPRLAAEEGDFVEFIVRLWSSQVDGEKVYVRSTKLLALALLLSEYGWMIDTLLEDDNLQMVPIRTDTGALSVIYGSLMAEDPQREYIENHTRHVKIHSRKSFHPTAVCPLLHMGEVTGRSFSNSEEDQGSFMRGYDASSGFCSPFNVEVRPSGHIRLGIESCEPRSGKTYQISCENVLNRYLHGTVPPEVKNLISAAMYEEFPEYDWTELEETIKKQLNPDATFTWTLGHFQGNSEKLWCLIGALIGILDRIILSLVNLPNDCRFRIPVGQGLEWYVSACCSHLNNLIRFPNGDGLNPEHAVELCAVRLNGLPSQTTPTDRSVLCDIIGHWNAQQGVILTPIFERKLYEDLPKEKSKPLTFYNVPILGIPTNEDGWIQIGRVNPPVTRYIETSKNALSKPCDVVMEYRPDFERNQNTVVAGLYVEGVFCHLLRLENRLSANWHVSSHCDHARPVEEPSVNRIALDSFEPGETYVLRHEQVAVLGPHSSDVSRMCSATLYRGLLPILQYGCLSCALEEAQKKKSCIIITPLDESAQDLRT